jgi:ABC-type nitrate/sulfonate/bicarbonate transport system substrate-binding protein
MSTMTSRSRFLAASAGIAVSAGLPVYISAQAALTPLKVAATPSDDCTPLIYGLKTGIFARNGIDLQITKMTSGAAVAAGVVRVRSIWENPALPPCLRRTKRGFRSH